MASDLNQAKDLVELGNLENYIKDELVLDCQVLESTPEVPVNSLAVKLEDDEQGRSRVANLMFMPLEDSDIEDVKLLQFFCETPVTVSSEHTDALLKFIQAVNLKIPIGVFAVNSDNQLVSKYVYSLGKFKLIEKGEFIETFLLWMYALDNLGPLLEEVATGKKDLETALQELDA